MSWPPINPVTGEVLLIPADLHEVDHEAYWQEALSCNGGILPEPRCRHCVENTKRRMAYYGASE